MILRGMISTNIRGASAPPPAAESPNAFASDGWSVLNSGLGGRVDLTITTLPADNGYAITDIQYKVNTGAWTSVGAATTGTYEIAGLTDDVEYTFQVRARNSEGPGTASSTKTETPTLATPAVISDETFTDATDIVGFRVDQVGTWYWAVTGTSDNPTGSQIVAGTGGGILEAGSQAFTEATSFNESYTNAVGAHGDTRRLHYLVDPSATGVLNSNIIRQNFVVELAPAAFAVGDWNLTNAATDGELTVTINALPDNNGYAISDIKYRANGGSWTSFGAAVTGAYAITGLANDALAEIEIRAVNAEGDGDVGPSKSETPTLAASYLDDLVFRVDADEGVVADGTEITSWTDSIGGLIFNSKTGTPQYLINGSPALRPLIYLPSGAALSIPSLTGSALPSGNAARTMMILAAIPGGASSSQGVMYGTNVASQAFGITFNSSELPVADHWAGGTTGTTSMADMEYRVIAVTYASGTETLYVNNVSEGTPSTGLTLNTPLNIFRMGRDLAGTSKLALGVLAVLVWDSVQSAPQMTEAYNALVARHLAA